MLRQCVGGKFPEVSLENPPPHNGFGIRCSLALANQRPPTRNARPNNGVVIRCPLRPLRARASYGNMKVIRLDASKWRSPEDFYSALLPQLGAPSWHGRNLDALADSLYGGINKVEPPFTVIVEGAESLSAEMREFLSKVGIAFDDVRTETQANIAFEVHQAE